MKTLKKVAIIALSITLMGCGDNGTDATDYDKSEQTDTPSPSEAALLESEEESSAEGQELIDKFEYDYDENNNFTVGIFKGETTGDISVSAFCNYSEENIGLMQDDFMYIWMYPYTEGFDVSIMPSVGESTYFYLMNDGKVQLNNIPLEPLEEFPEEYMEQFEERRDGLIEFYTKNGIIKQDF